MKTEKQAKSIISVYHKGQVCVLKKNSPQIYESKDLLFRTITENDTDDLLRLRNNSNVKKNFIYRCDITKEEHLNWVRNTVNSGKAIQFIIIIKEHNKPIGSVYIRDIDKKNKKAEFGIFIGDESEHGKGYGKQASKFMVRYFFEVMKYNILTLRVLNNNTAAIRCYKSVGFKQIESSLQEIKIEDKTELISFMSISFEEYRANLCK